MDFFRMGIKDLKSNSPASVRKLLKFGNNAVNWIESELVLNLILVVCQN